MQLLAGLLHLAGRTSVLAAQEQHFTLGIACQPPRCHFLTMSLTCHFISLKRPCTHLAKHLSHMLHYPPIFVGGSVEEGRDCQQIGRSLDHTE